MTSVRATNPQQVEAFRSPAREFSTRLSMKPNSAARGALDGAWWPRSTDPAVELAALIEAVGAQRGPVRRVSLNMSRWDSAPRRILLGSGRRVAVDWFQASGVDLVRIMGTDHRRIDLLLVPVDTG